MLFFILLFFFFTFLSVVFSEIGLWCPFKRTYLGCGWCSAASVPGAQCSSLRLRVPTRRLWPHGPDSVLSRLLCALRQVLPSLPFLKVLTGSFGIKILCPHTMIWGICSHFMFSGEVLHKIGIFFFKCLTEFSSKAIAGWSFLYGEAFNYRFCFF